MTAEALTKLRASDGNAAGERSAIDLLNEVERLRTQLRDLVTHLDDDRTDPTRLADRPADARDRLYVAEQVTHRLDWLRRDAWDLDRLLQGETLSPLFHESLCEVIQALQRLAAKAKPRASEQADAA